MSVGTARFVQFFCVLVWMVYMPVYGDLPELPRGKGEHCVEPTDMMRKNHMTFLTHQRDKTVHEGVRTKKHSLVGCIDCHVQANDQGEHIPVDAPGQFCQICHEFASVKLDCFECHATTPDTELSALQSLDLEFDGMGAFTSVNRFFHTEQQLLLLKRQIERSLGQ